MATLSTQTITRVGLDPAYVACAVSGDECRPSERTFLHVKNGHTSPQGVTVVTPGTVEGQAIEDLTVSVPDAAERMIGPLSPSLFRDPSDGMAAITYPDGVTALTIAVVQI